MADQHSRRAPAGACAGVRAARPCCVHRAQQDHRPHLAQRADDSRILFCDITRGSDREMDVADQTFRCVRPGAGCRGVWDGDSDSDNNSVYCWIESTVDY